MREHGAMELLEKRIHQTNMKEFLENKPDVHPPGLNIDSEYEITIRRK
jgi:predicted RNA-binding protein with PUA domain